MTSEAMEHVVEVLCQCVKDRCGFSPLLSKMPRHPTLLTRVQFLYVLLKLKFCLTRAAHSFISSYFTLKFSKQPNLLERSLCVATPSNEVLFKEYVYIDYKVKVQGRKLLGDFRNNRF